jgi:hypothetical protein
MTVSYSTPPVVDVFQNSIDNYRLVDHKEWTYAEWLQHEDREEKFAVQSPCKAGNSDKKGIQLTIQKLQNQISKVQQYSSRFSNLNSAVSVFINEESGPGKEIKKYLDIATGDVAGYVKNILGGVRGWVLNEVQKNAKKLLPFLFPGEMPSFLDKLNKGTNIISCAFAKIVRGLFDTVGKLLLDLIDKFVNGPMCIVEDFISNLLGNILGPITSAINAALSFISGAVSNLANSLFNALDFITGILNFFDCDDDKACPVVDEVNLAGTAALAGDPVAGSAGRNDRDGTASTGAPGTANLNTAGGAAGASTETPTNQLQIGESNAETRDVAARERALNAEFGTTQQAQDLLNRGDFLF